MLYTFCIHIIMMHTYHIYLQYKYITLILIHNIFLSYVLLHMYIGICTQTHAVLYKALKERMKPCIILNKIDRLLLDMQLTSVEAFYHLRR